jgi:hypothetical protein
MGHGVSLAIIALFCQIASVRERMFIDQLLPKYEAEEIVDKMRKAGFLVGDGEADTLEVVSAYKRFYRFYPHFHYVTF